MKELLFGYVTAERTIPGNSYSGRRADIGDIMAALEFAERASFKLPTLCAALSSRVPSVRQVK